MPLAIPLTWHIKNAKHSRIGKFLQERFAHTTSLTADANRLLKQADTLLLNAPTSSYPHGYIGMAIDYRIRYSFSITPNQELAAFTGARMLPHMSEFFMERPYSPELIDTFFASLDATLKTVQPVRRRLETAAERILARYCYVLSLFEEVYRNPREAQKKGRLFEPPPKKSVDELLAIPEDIWIDDLCAMAWSFYDNYHNLLSRPCKLNPGFMGIGDIATSDGDLIVDGCLIEIKASKNSSLDPKWLRQLAGYLLLDFNDTYSIHSVSIYMAGQGLLLPPWSVTDCLRLLTGDNTVTLTQLRQEFRTLAEKGVQEKRKEEKTVQTRTVVEQPTARHWITRVMLEMAVLNAVLDNMLKMDDLNISELTKEVEKHSKDITREISTAPHDVDDTVLEGVKRINGKLIELRLNGKLIELRQKNELMDGEKSTEELISMARQFQVTISDVHSMLNASTLNLRNHL